VLTGKIEAQKFIGVRKINYGKWEAYISLNRKFVHIGTFSSAEDAAKAFDRSARKANRTNLNFPNSNNEKSTRKRKSTATSTTTSRKPTATTTGTSDNSQHKNALPSVYRGVNQIGRKFVVRFNHNKVLTTSRFDTEIEAAKEYDRLVC
jgi:membrane-bound lytic murein transglycosylase